MDPLTLIWVAVAVVSAALSYILRPKVASQGSSPEVVRPDSDIEVPTAKAGSTIPVIFGTVHISQPNVVWYGDLKIQPAYITKDVSGGGGGKK